MAQLINILYTDEAAYTNLLNDRFLHLLLENHYLLPTDTPATYRWNPPMENKTPKTRGQYLLAACRAKDEETQQQYWNEYNNYSFRNYEETEYYCGMLNEPYRPAWMENGVDLDRKSFERMMLFYTLDPTETYFTVFLGIRDDLRRVSFTISFIKMLYRQTHDHVWGKLGTYIIQQEDREPGSTSLQLVATYLVELGLIDERIHYYPTQEYNPDYYELLEYHIPPLDEERMPQSKKKVYIPPRSKTSNIAAVYTIKDKATQEIIYIGQTYNFTQRKQQHLSGLRGNNNNSFYPQARADGYNDENVEIAILQQFESGQFAERSQCEKENILKYKPKYNVQYLH